MNWSFVLLGAALGIAVSPAPSFAADEGGDLLRKLVVASKRISYSGTFVYRHGSTEETSRIAVSADEGREHIEVLDGSPREVLRDGQVVKCYLPAENLLIIERASSRREFPRSMLGTGADVSGQYSIQAGPSGRVAGREARAIRLEPRDRLRYAHELWVDAASGILLKSAMRDEQGTVLESFAFTQVSIGGPLEPGALAPKFDQRRLTVRTMESSEVRPEDMGWMFRKGLAGFRKQSAMRRPSPTGGEGVHVMFSDGLASISVFLESGTLDAPPGLSRVGPLNVFRRQIDGFHALVMGEVPAAAVRQLGEGIERRMR